MKKNYFLLLLFLLISANFNFMLAADNYKLQPYHDADADAALLVTATLDLPAAEQAIYSGVVASPWKFGNYATATQKFLIYNNVNASWGGGQWGPLSGVCPITVEGASYQNNADFSPVTFFIAPVAAIYKVSTGFQYQSSKGLPTAGSSLFQFKAKDGTSVVNMNFGKSYIDKTVLSSDFYVNLHAGDTIAFNQICTLWGDPFCVWTKLQVMGNNGGVAFTETEATQSGLYFDNYSAASVTGISLQGKATILVGKSLNLNYNLIPLNVANKSVTWSSSDHTVATVNSDGQVTAVSAGEANITATTVDGNFTASTSVTSTTGSAPYLGVNWAIPGTIEAENYDEGGEGVAYHDQDATQLGASNGNFRSTEGVDVEQTADVSGGYNIGWTSLTEWLRYSVDVATAGSYELAFRYAIDGNGGAIDFSFASGADNVTGSITAPSTGGWGSFTTINTTVQLKAGPQVMIINPGTNINYYTLTLLTATGVSTQESNNLFTLYPNPTNGVITIKMSDYKNVDLVQIVDLVGVVVKTINVKQEMTSIDLTELATGLYFAKVIAGNTTKIQKFTKR